MGKQAVQQDPEAPKTGLPVSKETTDMARVSSEATNGSWFTPIRLLVTFCLINFINFVHRGAVASNGVNGNPKICTPSGQCTPGSGIQ
ncbi:hypothetical protein RHGRI_018339 [Rhododendron griersonianum]|uniref:Uncharacterized protein n=1 Tax=Rhododendron griersonianum TaxID=479676 RepID=A0AAV6K158_9ERIC|nr:hypothetical protein RHGRI_018339 [Rhododendron griersonianum]